MKKIKGFTLAEVLITLAIIGVVAALTIPSVIINYKKNMYATQLKKEYNNIINAFHTAMARDGVTKLSDTKLWTSMPNDDYNYITALMASPEFMDEFSKVFNTITKYSGNSIYYAYLDGSGKGHHAHGSFIVLADGASLHINFKKTPRTASCGDHPCSSLKEFQEVNNTPTKLYQWVGEMAIDVNGYEKGPNRLGRDYFWFYVGDDGNIYPWGGTDVAVNRGSTYASILANTASEYWKYRNGESCDPNTSKYSQGCAARIMEEGWKMNY